ncbi:OprD family porin [Pseudomonas fluorescens]|uniref:Porin-like protein NicP n=1 Tax=Pseudomonas fluorescens TaxID=294 RepID=A0A5E7T532_PSEFL|nr:OprD family porin [Pseudomonas fluorescens]VVP93649.1 Porin-like protein NicP [Pseudomonas fluorescens]
MQKLPLAHACALTCVAPILTLPCIAQADFLGDSSTTLSLRNFYFNRDFRQDNTAQSKREEWAQGFMFNAKSGYTEGPVGFGVDLYAALGVKLDSSDARAGTGLLPNAFGNAGPDEFSDLSGVFKAKVSKTELKVGGLMPKSPVALSSDARLLPPFFNGIALTSTDVDNLMLDVGQFRSVNYRNSSANHDDLRTGNYSASSDRFDYAGAAYTFGPQLTASFWRAELEDVYQQNYYGLLATQTLGRWTLGGNLGYFDSSEAGAQRAGTIDNGLTSVLLSANLGGHTWRVGYQDNRGRSPFPFLQDADPNVANVVQILDFTRAHERSWQARYDVNMAAFGVPGLTFLARYLRGDGFEVAGSNAQEWERDLDVSYVIQSGPLKNLGMRWRNAMVRSDALGDLDENRVILSYTYAFK